MICMRHSVFVIKSYGKHSIILMCIRMYHDDLGTMQDVAICSLTIIYNST